MQCSMAVPTGGGPAAAAQRPPRRCAANRLARILMAALTAMSAALSWGLCVAFLGERRDGGGGADALATGGGRPGSGPPRPPPRAERRVGLERRRGGDHPPVLGGSVEAAAAAGRLPPRRRSGNASSPSPSSSSPSYALVYPNADCSGEVFLCVDAASTEKRCRGCRDLCSVSFPGDGRRANEATGARSVAVRGGGGSGGGAFRAELYFNCLGTWDYPDEQVLEIVSPPGKRKGKGCVAVMGSFGHLKLVPAGAPLPSGLGLGLPVAASDEPGEESYALLYPSEYCEGEPLRINYSSREGGRCEHCRDLCKVRFDEEEVKSVALTKRKSLRVFGAYQLDVHNMCLDKIRPSMNNATGYQGTVRVEDGCVNLAQGTGTVGHLRFARREARASPVVENEGDNAPRSYHVAFSVESSTYMAWQSRALAHSFRQTQPADAARLTRLLTAKEPDDLMDEFRTVQAPRHPYSKVYSPYNKPDSLDKWLHSPYAPKEEVLVVIDPDNFLLKDLSGWASQVERGRPIAQSWFVGDQVDELWSLMCERNCNRTATDHVAVPLFIHRDDLTEIAPLWSYYTMKVKWNADTGKLEEFRDSQIITWTVEMIGYVFASAHVGVRHRVERYLQLRDLDPLPADGGTYAEIPMLHAGRAFFPESYAEGKRWHNTEGEEISRAKGRGRQVWCKCNFTAWDVVPWPLPPGGEHPIDFVSNHTLRILHEAKEENPTFPASRFRRVGGGGNYLHKYD